ncbi:putative colanic acid biosynthesis acetyltransferase [Sphingomonas sp. Y38-1Y]|uniref:putative colanic acid biosynthesis acetyltransferase n=1 Tax=Sphingomonas sp. Y38-1Y TaxID=3078265 RepID=UPI0028E61E24|nr:putative colanic acid biosynthesis acetyltransferase [Sphingomonas sp. Y38-1Y]
MADADPLDAAGTRGAGPSFSRRNRAERALFTLVWTVAARWTPPPLHRWRCTILRAFGAEVGRGVRLYGSTIVWHPANLSIGAGALIGPRVRLYNQGRIGIGAGAVVSQGAHLCASTHDLRDADFQLLLRPITIGADAWIAAEAFVGPGVTVGDGAVLGARGAAFDDLEPCHIYRGNPAAAISVRERRAW